MSKAGLIAPLLKIAFTKPSVIFKSLYHAVKNDKCKNIVTEKHGFKNGLPVIDLLDLFPVFNESIENYSCLYGTSEPSDLALLKLLAKKFNGNCRYLEIGSWRGESLAVMSEVCKEVVSVSLSAEQMREMKFFSERDIELHSFFSKGIKNVQHIGGNSFTYNFNQLGKFDLIFIDGDHSYEGVKNDTQKMFDMLKDETSIIVWHDYAPSYEILGMEVFAGILDGCPKEKHNKLYHLSNTQCAIFINEKVKSSAREFPSIPTKKFSFTLKASKL